MSVDMRRLLKDLIAIDSVNPSMRPAGGTSGELAVCEFLKAVFEQHGLSPEIVEVLPGRPNLYATLEAGRDQTVILSAHTDTVPAEDWDTDPFDPREDDGVLFGRGSCDTKASLAVFAATMLHAAASGSCAYNLAFAAVCDEEAGFAGSKAAARRLMADFAIAGEPTRLQALNRHKGVMRFVVTASGQSCHSSTPDLGENAIYALADAVLALKRLAREWADVRDPVLGARTMAVTTIAGGQAANVVPDSARAQVDVRSLPGDEADDLIGALRSCCPENVDVNAPYMAGPPLYTPEDSPLVQRFLTASGRPLTSAPYATDAAEYAAAGIPAIVYGPGDAALAHTTREQIRISEVEEAARVLDRFLSL